MNRPIPSWRRLRPGVRLALVVLVAGLTLPACGKKGPPLPPLVKLPARPDAFLARRLGSTVYIQVRIPSANADGKTPADIRRMDIYGFTGSPAGNEDILKRGTLVASIPVRQPPKEDEDQNQPKDQKSKHGAPPPTDKTAETTKATKTPPPPPRPPASMENGFDQGDTVVVTEPLGPAQMKLLPPLVKEQKKPAPEAPALLAPPLGPPLPTVVLSRVYIAVGINHKRQKGTPSGRQVVALEAGASAPAAPTVTYDESGFTVAWTPPADMRLEIQAPATGTLLTSRTFGMATIGGGVNVYEVPPPAPPPRVGARPFPALPVAAEGVIPAPLNEKPLRYSPFVDTRMEFGTVRCYVVRTLTQFGPLSTQSEASPPTCVSPVDTFPPAPPKALQAVGGEGVVGLAWEANTEPDLAGYLVMRANPADLQWVFLTPAPITETSYRDTTGAKGVRYQYVVVAVDKANNRSKPSNLVEEAAR